VACGVVTIAVEVREQLDIGDWQVTGALPTTR
jgi:hypothetical protein